MNTLRTVAMLTVSITLGCGGSQSNTPLPALQNLNSGEQPVDGADLTADGKPKAGGENHLGPKRSDTDKKIAEIKDNKTLSEDLKKQLIEEVERTYRESQGGFRK